MPIVPSKPQPNQTPSRETFKTSTPDQKVPADSFVKTWNAFLHQPSYPVPTGSLCELFIDSALLRRKGDAKEKYTNLPKPRGCKDELTTYALTSSLITSVAVPNLIQSVFGSDWDLLSRWIGNDDSINDCKVPSFD